jgi:hypothetical protein
VTTAKNWVADKNATFRMEDMIKLAHNKFSSISKDDWKLRCNHIIAIEAQYVAPEGLLETVRKLLHIWEMKVLTVWVKMEMMEL